MPKMMRIEVLVRLMWLAGDNVKAFSAERFADLWERYQKTCPDALATVFWDDIGSNSYARLCKLVETTRLELERLRAKDERYRATWLGRTVTWLFMLKSP